MADSAILPVLPLAGKHHVFLAVSGGSDSTALLHLAARQILTLGNPPELTAITVDHRLRTGSTAEARAVESMCAALGVRHRTLVWEGPKPVSGIQDAARNARRNLIAAAAGKAGADAVFSGHTVDDQLETVAMRQKRGPGPGLAGIAPATFVFNDTGSGEPIPFWRPFLGTSRAALRAFLGNNGISWIDDPSNDNSAFERVAIRKELAVSGPLRRLELNQLQQSAAKGRMQTANRVGKIIDARVFFTAPGLTRIDYEFAADGPYEDVINALRVLQAFASAMPVLAEESHARSMYAAAGAYSEAGATSAKFGRGGALTEFRKQGLYLSQEHRRAGPGARPFAGRYRLTGAEPYGMQASPRTDPVLAPASLIRKAAAAEPIFDCPHSGATSCDEAYRSGRRLRLLLNPWPDLVPSFDLPAYNALAAMAGAPQLDLPLL